MFDPGDTSPFSSVGFQGVLKSFGSDAANVGGESGGVGWLAVYIENTAFCV